jgi:hypothetical protein
MIAPASRRRATTTLSSLGRKSRSASEPLVAGASRIQMWSLTVTGTPSSGGGFGSPRRRFASRAARRASSANVTVHAFSSASYAAIATSARSTASTGETRPSRMARASAVASSASTSAPTGHRLAPSL